MACKYCATPVPPPEPAAAGPATCVCSVLAARRCLRCDTPVCDQHSNAFWSGQVTTPLATTGEQAMWAWETAAERVPLDGASPEALCTACRARRADDAVTALRALPDGLTDVERSIEAVRAGLDAPVLMTATAPTEWVRGFASYLRRVGYPQRRLVSAGVVRRKGAGNAAVEVAATTDCWLVPLDHSPRPLFLAIDADGQTAGWMNVARFHARCKGNVWIDPNDALVFPSAGDPRAVRAVRYEGDAFSRRGQHISVHFGPPDPSNLDGVADAGGNVRVAIVAGLLDLGYRNGNLVRAVKPAPPSSAAF